LRKYFNCILFKNIWKYNCARSNQLIHTYAHKNAQLFLNYNVEILQHEILYIQHMYEFYTNKESNGFWNAYESIFR